MPVNLGRSENGVRFGVDVSPERFYLEGWFADMKEVSAGVKRVLLTVMMLIGVCSSGIFPY